MEQSVGVILIWIGLGIIFLGVTLYAFLWSTDVLFSTGEYTLVKAREIQKRLFNSAALSLENPGTKKNTQIDPRGEIAILYLETPDTGRKTLWGITQDDKILAEGCNSKCLCTGKTELYEGDAVEALVRCDSLADISHVMIQIVRNPNDYSATNEWDSDGRPSACPDKDIYGADFNVGLSDYGPSELEKWAFPGCIARGLTDRVVNYTVETTECGADCVLYTFKWG